MATTNQMRQIVLAMRNYQHRKKVFPPAVVRDKDGKPLYIWRVLLLPYVEAEHLYREFRRDEPWDSPHNRQFLDQMPRAYASPCEDSQPGWTRFQVLVGPGTAFERPGLKESDFPDGVASSVFLVQARDPVPWTKPDDLAYDPEGPLPALLESEIPTRLFRRIVYRTPGYDLLCGDGSARSLRQPVDESRLRALITRNGGEPLPD